MPRVFADPLRERAARYATILTLDAACSAGALLTAMVLRFEEGIPEPYLGLLPGALALVVASRLIANTAARLHRWAFRISGLDDAVRLAAAALGGSALLVALARLLMPPGFPRTVYALEFFLSSTGFTVLRFGPRVALRWWSELRRRRSGASPTLVVGVNFAAELLAQDILRSPRSDHAIVGFAASDASELGRRIEGKPVLGLAADLPELVARHRISTVLLAVARPAVAGLRAAIAECASRGVHFKILPACASLAEPVSAAMLDDLAPEDLLPRPAAGGDRGELRRRLAGRCALVTGAGGAIGGEICRQLVHHGVRRLVMVDADAGALERRARRLAREQPEVDVHAEVADLRQAGRLARLGERFHPDYVFHAPAGAHAGPADGTREGARMGVLATVRVARMAEGCGAHRLVLVCGGASTPAAAAAERAAERAARDLARTARTRVTAVRLGDVLGWAAGAAPLADERGGPAEAGRGTRPLMTVPEAAALALAAGVGDRREPCVVGRGAPIPLDEWTRLAAALTGAGRAAPAHAAVPEPAAEHS